MKLYSIPELETLVTKQNYYNLKSWIRNLVRSCNKYIINYPIIGLQYANSTKEVDLDKLIKQDLAIKLEVHYLLNNANSLGLITINYYHQTVLEFDLSNNDQVYQLSHFLNNLLTINPTDFKEAKLLTSIEPNMQNICDQFGNLDAALSLIKHTLSPITN